MSSLFTASQSVLSYNIVTSYNTLLPPSEGFWYNKKKKVRKRSHDGHTEVAINLEQTTIAPRNKVTQPKKTITIHKLKTIILSDYFALFFTIRHCFYNSL